MRIKNSATTLVNNLGRETSLYLLQHRDNPVAWQPWGEPAFTLAAELNRPVFLSIGYAACHWCHVMARESFADAETARCMNEGFINIKVDREERPDLDDIYQTAHQLLTGRAGGWPLTVFLCPKTRLPFIAGTYFPPESAHGQLGFRDLLARVSEFYQQQPRDFANLRNQVKRGFNKLEESPLANQELLEGERLSRELLGQAAKQILGDADRVYGGFGNAPKFPMPFYLERLLMAAEEGQAGAAGSWAEEAGQHLLLSLAQMGRGGVYDLLEGGFFRYSTDQQWQIPHFEKLLCDNGLLLWLYSRAYAHWGWMELAQVVKGIASWAFNRLQQEGGGFGSSMDADSLDDSGQTSEGACYVWAREQLQQALSLTEYDVLNHVCGLDRTPNFHGRWHLCRQHHELNTRQAQTLFTGAQVKLQILRARRPQPTTDTKVLCSWNALMVRGLALAARVFHASEYTCAAQRAVDFIRQHLWINHRLFASWQRGEAKLSAYLDDYVFLMDALLELLQTQWRDEDYRLLIGLAESVCQNFEDSEQGGFYFTAHDHETLIYRNKPFGDSVMPSGNGIAAKVFSRLGQLAAEPRYLDCARRTVTAGWRSVLQQPHAHHNLLLALEELTTPAPTVFIAGSEAMAEWQRQVQQRDVRIHCYWFPHQSQLLPPEAMALEPNHAIVCLGDRCLPSQNSLAGLMAQLEAV